MERERSVDQDLARYGAVVEDWLATLASARTRARCRADLELFGRWCAKQGSIPLRADTATVAAFQAARRVAGDSASTLRRRASSLSSFYRYAITADAADANPVSADVRSRIRPGHPRPDGVVSPASVAAYATTVAALDPRLEALVGLLVFDGLNLSEAPAVDKTAITPRAPPTSVLVRGRRSTRWITLEPPSARAVRRCAGRRPGQPLLVRAGPVGTGPRRLNRFGANRLLRRLSAQSGHPITVHALRRLYFTRNRAGGTDLAFARQRAGPPRGERRYEPSPNEKRT
jgi:site-specific recombinase XerD